jgi:hypothetical protein
LPQRRPIAPTGESFQTIKEFPMKPHTGKHKNYPDVIAFADAVSSPAPVFACAVFSGLVAALFSLVPGSGLL